MKSTAARTAVIRSPSRSFRSLRSIDPDVGVVLNVGHGGDQCLGIEHELAAPEPGDQRGQRHLAAEFVGGAGPDGLGMSLYAKRLERGRFIWPSPADGVAAISAAQLAYMLDGIDWRNPRHTFRPERAG